MDRAMIEQKANELLSLPFVSGIFPVPVEKIAEHLGFSCHPFSPDSSMTAISGAVDHKDKSIFVNDRDPVRRQFFTVAHEIGHIVLNGENADYIDYRSNFSDPKEFDANYFAGCLLMPAEVFRFKWREYQKNLDMLSDFFGASPSAIAIRADILGLD